MDANLKIPVFSVLWKKQHGLCSKRKRKKEKKKKEKNMKEKKEKKIFLNTIKLTHEAK